MQWFSVLTFAGIKFVNVLMLREQWHCSLERKKSIRQVFITLFGHLFRSDMHAKKILEKKKKHGREAVIEIVLLEQLEQILLHTMLVWPEARMLQKEWFGPLDFRASFNLHNEKNRVWESTTNHIKKLMVLINQVERRKEQTFEKKKWGAFFSQCHRESVKRKPRKVQFDRYHPSLWDKTKQCKSWRRRKGQLKTQNLNGRDRADMDKALMDKMWVTRCEFLDEIQRTVWLWTKDVQERRLFLVCVDPCACVFDTRTSLVETVKKEWGEE